MTPIGKLGKTHCRAIHAWINSFLGPADAVSERSGQHLFWVKVRLINRLKKGGFGPIFGSLGRIVSPCRVATTIT
jgi:hypothetical protein